MCITLSPTKHFLLTVGGARWKEVWLAMFTVYIDDSGTDPSQSLAIAAGIIVPATNIDPLDRAWSELLDYEFIRGFHSSECAAGQEGTDFENWSWQRKKRVFWKVREITKTFAVKAFSCAINKADYDQFVTGELRDVGGKYHYTWAVRHVVAYLDMWALLNGISIPFEYLFDWMGESKRNSAKREIEIVMSQAESVRAGFYEGQYQFKKRRNHPGLQCVDLLAWSCYQFGRSAIFQVPCHPLAWESFWDFDAHNQKNWLHAVTQKPEDLKIWAEQESADERSQRRRRLWLDAHKKKSEKAV